MFLKYVQQTWVHLVRRILVHKISQIYFINFSVDSIPKRLNIGDACSIKLESATVIMTLFCKQQMDQYVFIFRTHILHRR